METTPIIEKYKELLKNPVQLCFTVNNVLKRIIQKKISLYSCKKYKFMDQIIESNLTDEKLAECSLNKVSLETELSETLYNTMKDFVLSNPTWDQYKLINSALATFLFQNGCTDNSVSEIYLNQLFTPSKSF